MRSRHWSEHGKDWRPCTRLAGTRREAWPREEPGTRWALGGFALIVDYEQERDGAIAFTGHGVYTYDPKDDRYTLPRFDCMVSPPEVFVGRREGDVLTLAHGGPGMHARMTYDLSSPRTMRAKIEMSPDGNDWKVLFEATYKRISP